MTRSPFQAPGRTGPGSSSYCGPWGPLVTACKCLLNSTCPVSSTAALKPKTLTGLRLISVVFKPFLRDPSPDREGLALQVIADSIGRYSRKFCSRKFWLTHDQETDHLAERSLTCAGRCSSNALVSSDLWHSPCTATLVPQSEHNRKEGEESFVFGFAISAMLFPQL